VERWIQEAVAANRLQRVVRGLFLNRLIAPAAQLCEAAVWLRPGKVTAIVPLSSRYTTPSLGRVEAGAGIFVFRGISERVLEAGLERDRLAGHEKTEATGNGDAPGQQFLNMARTQ
jgi:hypothetical protein